MLGIKFGEWKGKGIVLYSSYYIGHNIFGEYYNQRTRDLGFGFFIDFL
jgi:hypothetical protein